MANASIFSQYIKPVRSMQDYANDYDVAEQNQLALAAKRMDMQKAQRGMADADTARGIAEQRRRAFASSGGDSKAYRNALQMVGDYEGVIAFDTQEQTRLKAEADLGKVGAETRGKDAETESKGFELAKNRYGQYRMALGALAGDPGLTKEKAVGVAQGLVQAGILTPEFAQNALQNLPDDPNALRQDIQAGIDMQLTPEQLTKLFAPNWKSESTGARKLPVQTNPRAPGFNADQTLTMEQTPDSVASNARTVSEGVLNRGVQIRGQNLTDSRARDKLNLESGNSVADAGGPSQVALVKQFGKAPPGYRWKLDGNAEAIPGGPADLKNNAGTAAKVTDAQDVLSLLDQAEPLLDKSTGSYLGAAIDEAGRAVGGATGGARAAAQLRALEGALIAKMPKMSGPQSDKDVLLYKQMAGQIGDRTIPADQKRAAIQTIREINNRHAGVAPKAGRIPVRTGKLNGRKVIEYSDGTTAYAD